MVKTVSSNLGITPNPENMTATWLALMEPYHRMYISREIDLIKTKAVLAVFRLFLIMRKKLISSQQTSESITRQIKYDGGTRQAAVLALCIFSEILFAYLCSYQRTHFYLLSCYHCPPEYFCLLKL